MLRTPLKPILSTASILILLLTGCGSPESANAHSDAVSDAAVEAKATANTVVASAETAAKSATAPAPASAPEGMEMIKLPEDCEEMQLDMIKCPLADDVEMDDAAESMKLRANMLNFKLVAHMPLSEQVKAMGGESKRMEIYQFCDASIAAKMVAVNLAFAGYLPCRIAMVEDQAGKNWLITLNMDKTMGRAELPKDLMGMGMSVRNNIYNIIGAGATGDL